MKTVATFSKPEEAHLLRMRLEDAGIEAFVQGEHTVEISNALGGVRVQVADEDAESARELLTGKELGIAGDELHPSCPVKQDSSPREGTARIWPYVGLILLLAGIPLLYAIFHFHDFVNYVQNEAGGAFPSTIAAGNRMHKAAASLVDRGIAKGKTGDLDGALADFDSALKLNPDDAYAYINHGATEAYKKNFPDAMADYNKAVRLRPDKAPAYVLRGLLKKIMKDLDGALDDYNKALEIDPNNSVVYEYRGSVKRAGGDSDGALADYDKAIHLKPDSSDAYSNRAMLQKEKGDLDAAMADFNEAIRLNPKTSIFYAYLGSVKEAKGDLDGALADFDKAIQLKPDSAGPYLCRVALEKEKGDFEAAMLDCNKAIALGPNNHIPYEYRGDLKAATGDLDGALADFDKAIELSKNPSGNAFHYRGCFLFDIRKFTEALADFRKVTEFGLADVLDNDYPHFRIYLARALLGENEAATEELRTYLSNRKTRQQDEWPLKVGNFLAGQLSETDFINAATDANEMKSKRKHCEAWFYAGMKRLISGDKVTAQEDFKKCVATGQTVDLEYASAAASLKYLNGQ